jgi:hypothetical protein
MTEGGLQTLHEDAENDLRDPEVNKWRLQAIGGNEATFGYVLYSI